MLKNKKLTEKFRLNGSSQNIKIEKSTKNFRPNG